MSYTFKNTEINNEKANDFETKSLLYLIGKRKDSKKVEYVTFDCFNDINGINKKLDEIWDIQSKNEKKLNPKKIGKYLFTLFDNYLSPFTFKEFIFFCPILETSYKKNVNVNIYNLSNIKDKTFDRIKNGLLEEVERVKGIKSNYKSQIDLFLDKVIIVEDNNSKSEYIESVTKFKNVNIKSNDFYNSVFNDIRKVQTDKKNSLIENETILEIKEVLSFQRHLSVKEIETLIISRIIGFEVFDNILSIPFCFNPIIKHLDQEDLRDLLQDCNSNLSRAFFNKNSNRVFWNVCELIITFLSENDKNNPEEVYNLIFSNKKVRSSYLTDMTLKFLISIIIEGKR